MRAVPVNEAVIAFPVAVENEILAHYANRFCILPLEFADPGYWLPIAAQQFTHRSSGTGFAQQLITLAAQHMT